mgnify:CR=1 FL=1
MGYLSPFIYFNNSMTGIFYYNCQYHSMLINAIAVCPSAINYTWKNGVINWLSFARASGVYYTVIAGDGRGAQIPKRYAQLKVGYSMFQTV